MMNELYDTYYKIGQLTYNTNALLEIVQQHIDIEKLDIIDQIKVQAVLETVKANMETANEV